MLVDQQFTRLGGADKVRVDLRVISSTNRNLEAEIKGGRFRQELYHRLNVVPIAVPPLVERREDIPLLAQHFIELFNRTQGLPLRQLSDEAVTLMQTMDWPGNVRQLRNVVDWLLIMAPADDSGRITAEMLPPEIAARAPVAVRHDGGAELMAMPLREAREVFVTAERKRLADASGAKTLDQAMIESMRAQAMKNGYNFR